MLFQARKEKYTITLTPWFLPWWENWIAADLLDDGADLAFVRDWLGHANIQNTTIYAQLTNPARDTQARKLFASHRVV